MARLVRETPWPPASAREFRAPVGTEDPLRDDTLFLYARLPAARGPVELLVVPGAGHIFNLVPLSVAGPANERARTGSWPPPWRPEAGPAPPAGTDLHAAQPLRQPERVVQLSLSAYRGGMICPPLARHRPGA
ncbi:hypothetical protein [Catellatospora sp. NPDC049609]|uniref:hypothetical protein n=1 Tax=Catellatospora sp. NPDC049609 TaxID=3155505 RepID=UPI00341AA0D1